MPRGGASALPPLRRRIRRVAGRARACVHQARGRGCRRGESERRGLCPSRRRARGRVDPGIRSSTQGRCAVRFRERAEAGAPRAIAPAASSSSAASARGANARSSQGCQAASSTRSHGGGSSSHGDARHGRSRRFVGSIDQRGNLGLARCSWKITSARLTSCQRASGSRHRWGTGPGGRTLLALAAVAAQASHVEAAARLRGASLALHAACGRPRTAAEERIDERYLARLGEQALSAREAFGRSLTLDDAATYALDVAEQIQSNAVAGSETR